VLSIAFPTILNPSQSQHHNVSEYSHHVNGRKLTPRATEFATPPGRRSEPPSPRPKSVRTLRRQYLDGWRIVLIVGVSSLAISMGIKRADQIRRLHASRSITASASSDRARDLWASASQLVHSSGGLVYPDRITTSLLPPLEQRGYDWDANGSPAPSTNDLNVHSIASTNMSRRRPSPLSLWQKLGGSTKNRDDENSVHNGGEKQGWRGLLSRTQRRIGRIKQADKRRRAGVSLNPDAFEVQSTQIVPVPHLKPTDTDWLPSVDESAGPSSHQDTEQTDFERARADGYTLMTEQGFRKAQIEKLKSEIGAATRNLSEFQKYRQSRTDARLAAPPSEVHWLDSFGKQPTELDDWDLGTFIDLEEPC
jgi:hypothetical protein